MDKNRNDIMSYKNHAGAECLCRELNDYKKAGISVTVEGVNVEINRKLADMLLCEGPCTYMRNYSFDENGKITAVEFGTVIIRQ